MVELDILRKPLAELKLATTDIPQQTFDKVAACIEKEQMDMATEMIEEVLREGNFDLRLISYYLYAHFLKSGVKSFMETLPILTRLVNDHWEVLRPFNRKEKQIESSLNWFFTHVLSKLKFNERLAKEKKPLLWPLMLTQLSEKEFNELQETLTSFNEFFHQRWDQSSTKERVTHLVKKIGDLKPLILEEKDLEEVVEDQDPVLENKPSDLTLGLESSEKADQSPPSPFETAEMINLIKKLEIFERLIEKNDFLKAALVSKDITQAIEHFDPCSYFPNLFSTYFNLLARHSTMISEQLDYQESLQWKSLERLYKADVDQFKEW